MNTASRCIIGSIAAGLTAGARRRARRSGAGYAGQRTAFALLTRQIAASAYGREAGVEVGMTYEKFRRRVAPRKYESFAPFIERIKRGSGTSFGREAAPISRSRRARLPAAPNTCR